MAGLAWSGMRRPGPIARPGLATPNGQAPTRPLTAAERYQRRQRMLAPTARAPAGMPIRRQQTPRTGLIFADTKPQAPAGQAKPVMRQPQQTQPGVTIAPNFKPQPVRGPGLVRAAQQPQPTTPARPPTAPPSQFIRR